MAEIRLWHLGAILGLAMALLMTASHSEEDFAFEAPAAEEQEALSGLHAHPLSKPVQKLWGIPDTVANVGKLFHMKIPGDAFSGDVDHFEVSSMISKGRDR
jgi:neurexin